MDPDLVIPALEREWAQPDGFFGRLRMGVFDSDGFERVVRLIKSIHIDDRLVIDRRLVSLTWYMPLFMLWQRESLNARGMSAQELDRACNHVEDLVENLLGLP
jgi:hypothetical protein